MKKIILSIIFLFSTSMADSVLLVKKGWQLIGASTPIEDMSKFTSADVEQVWHFDADRQKWLGYSPDSDIQTKMSDNNVSKLTSLKNWHGFWVKSKKEWALTLSKTTMNTAPEDENTPTDTIELKEGWNLISLPVDTIVSADIFKDMTVWKYNPNKEWELFDEAQSQEDFPVVGHIKNSDGIWVKASHDTNISIMDEASKLHNFASKEEMQNHIKEMAMINYRPYWGIEPYYLQPVRAVSSDDTNDAMDMAVADAAGEATTAQSNGVKDATGTNLQESDVDEADIVKHDGNHIFYLVNNTINITSFEQLTSGKTQALNKIQFTNNRYISSMYLVNNRLVVLSNRYGEDIYIGDEIESTSSPRYAVSQVLVDIFDVTDINDIQTITSYRVDGNLVNSRVVGDELYLISSFTPQISITYPKIYMELSSTCKAYFKGSDDYYYDDDYYYRYSECYNIQRDYNDDRYYRYDYDNPIVEIQDLLPEIESDKMAKQDLIEPSKLYASAKKNQSSTMTTLTNISISEGIYKKSNSFIGHSSVQYASSKALYLVSEEYPIYYDFDNYKNRSMIYKFNLDNELSYRGIGSVYGTALNQFSLSEYNDILRIATTEGFSWSRIGTNNSIYTLKEQDKLLPIQGVLSGLGKEGETIKSVRFIGDRAFVVTFRQTDPFYTIDMSNPEVPQKVGELQVNGYSAYLHPVGEDKILGIGRDADSEGRVLGLKLELFDVSDFANPTSLKSITYSRSTYSEIEYNHKALAYRASDDLFAFPYRAYGDDSTDYRTNDYLGIYQIKENDLVAYRAIKNPSSSGWGEHRGLIFDMNESTYVSFFAGDEVITKELNTTEE